MTIVVLRINIGDTQSKAQEFMRLGDLAQAVEDGGMTIIDHEILHDGESATPVKQRKPRGPNKRKAAPVTGDPLDLPPSLAR